MKTTYQRAVCISSVLLLLGLGACQPKSTTTSSNTQANNPQASTQSNTSTSTTSTSTPMTSNTVASATAIQSADVTEAGIRALTYGQTVTKADLQRAGFAYPDRLEPDPLCYYVPVGAKSTADNLPANLLIMDNKFGSVYIQDSKISVFSGVKIGDSVAKVLAAHKMPPQYEVNKYDDGSASQYLLIYTLPNHNQIKYLMSGGKKLSSNDIAPNAWKATDKSLLTGTVDSIEVGTPETIRLVEGCS